MRLRVIGASGSVPGPGEPASSYLVSSGSGEDAFHLLLDCGPGSYGELQRHLDPARLAAVALSHLHPDHCLDLCALHVAGRHSPTAPWPTIAVYGPRGTRERIIAAYRADADADPGAELDGRFGFIDWRPEQRLGPFTVTTAAVAHPVPTVAIRVDDGSHAVVYSGDTGPCDALVDLARGADLLVCEAGFGVDADPPPGIHLTGAQAGDHAARAGVGRLLVTHIAPWHDPIAISDAAADTFDGEITLARTGMEIEL